MLEHTIEVIRLDTLMLSPDAVKIDVEGFEDVVVEGLRETIERCGPTFMIEYNNRSYRAVSSFFKEQRFREFQYLRASDTFMIYTGDPTLIALYIPVERLAGVSR